MFALDFKQLLRRHFQARKEAGTADQWLDIATANVG
jgi:hypothetical protein